MNQKSRTAWRRFFRVAYPVHPPDRQNSAECRLEYECRWLPHFFFLSLSLCPVCTREKNVNLFSFFFVSATLRNTLRFQIRRAMPWKVSFNGGRDRIFSRVSLSGTDWQRENSLDMRLRTIAHCQWTFRLENFIFRKFLLIENFKHRKDQIWLVTSVNWWHIVDSEKYILINYID